MLRKFVSNYRSARCENSLNEWVIPHFSIHMDISLGILKSAEIQFMPEIKCDDRHHDSLNMFRIFKRSQRKAIFAYHEW